MQVEPKALTELGIPINWESIVDSVVTAGAAITLVAFIVIVGFKLVNKLFGNLLESMGFYSYVSSARMLIREYTAAPAHVETAKKRFIEEFGERNYKRLKVNEQDAARRIRRGATSADLFNEHKERLRKIRSADARRRRNLKMLDGRGA